jgi:hypothetical protein
MLQIHKQFLSEDDNNIMKAIDKMLSSRRYSFSIARVLLEHVFVDWTSDKSVDICNNQNNYSETRNVRRFLVLDFYQLLCTKYDEYTRDIKDFSKNADYHHDLQQKMKKINEITLQLEKPDFHNEIIYYMNILS